MHAQRAKCAERFNMVIISNGLTTTADEGFLKVANSLVGRIKKQANDAFVISYERRSELTDCFLELNKFFLNPGLVSAIRKRNEPVLYIPFPAKPVAAALRTFLLSVYSKKKVSTLLVMTGKTDAVAKILLKLSRADIIVLSKSTENFYKSFLPNERVHYIKAGVDTNKFVPAENQKELKIKYGFEADKPVVLHVGHLKKGRNVAELLKIDSKYNVLLVTSTLTKDEQDSELKEKLLSRPNIRIIDSYIEAIEEVYQLCDVYFFPTVEKGNCIDVPLSCLEAAACSKPVITTDYGEMNELLQSEAFFRLDSFEKDEINQKIDAALNAATHTRNAVLEYDWNNAVKMLLDII